MLTFDLATLQKPQRLARVAQKAEQLVNAMAAAGKPFSQNQCFRYFCGVCWNIVRDGDHA